jgi:hypothetical protein
MSIAFSNRASLLMGFLAIGNRRALPAPALWRVLDVMHKRWRNSRNCNAIA